MEAAEFLFKCLEQVPDPRRARGVRHPFQAIFRLTLPSLVCEQTTMAHTALFARMNWPLLREPLGFHRDHAPHATTISRTLAGGSNRLGGSDDGGPGTERRGGRQVGQVVRGRPKQSIGDVERAGP